MFRKSVLASTLSLLLLPGATPALGLGEIRAESALNQPFAGEIDLLGADPEQLNAVKVALAPEAEFAKRGTERLPHLTKLRFKPQISPRGKAVVRVTSTEPLREPYMDLLVEVVWPKGRLVKGYTVLLDPPLTARRTAPVVEAAVAQGPVAAAPAPKPQPSGGRESTPPTEPAKQPEVPGAPQPVATGSAASFPLRMGPVKAGTGLWRAARKIAPPGATVAQTAMALYRNNQHAFVRGDINRLRKGEVLQIPTAAELFAIDADTAERELRAAFAGQRVTDKPLTDVSVAAATEAPQLRIAGAADAAGGRPGPGEGQAPPSIEQELLLVRETGESTRQETDELRERVRQLESSLASIQQLLTLRDAELARLQGAREAGPTAAAPGEAAPVEGPRLAGDTQPGTGSDVPASSTDGLPPVATPTEEGAGGPITGDQPVAQIGADGSAAAKPQPGAKPPVAPEASAAVAGAEGARTGDADTHGPQDGAGARPATAESDAATPAQSGTAWLRPLAVVGDALQGVPTPALWSAAVGLPLLGLLGWLAGRRRRRIEEALNVLVLPSAAPAEGTSVMAPAMAGAQAADDAYAQGPIAFGHQGMGGLDSEDEGSDVLAEADIYIAYGRYRDAEALLNDAIARAPGRADLHYKLADVYSSSRNQAALAALVDEMERAGMDQERPVHWSRLVALVEDADEGGAVPTAGAQTGAPAATTAGRSLDAPGWGGRESGDGEEIPVEPSPVASLGDLDRLAPDSTWGLPTGATQERDLTMGLEDLDLGPGALTPGAAAAPGEPDLAAKSMVMGDEDLDLELTMADLTLATEVDLAELGVVTPARPAQPGSEVWSPTGAPASSPAQGIEEVLAAESMLGLDAEPLVRPAEGPAGYGETTAPEWGEGIPAGPARRGGSGGRGWDLGPIEQDTASSDLLSSQWRLEGGMWDEVATKLDLGRAYFEMNDRQAAEAILLEVAEEGSVEQQAEARELLAQIRSA